MPTNYYRDILVTKELLEEYGACSRGVATFLAASKGRSATIRLDAKGFLWALKNRHKPGDIDVYSCDILGCKACRPLTRKDLYNYIEWAYQIVAGSDSELLASLAKAGIPLDQHGFFVTANTTAPKGWQSESLSTRRARRFPDKEVVPVFLLYRLSTRSVSRIASTRTRALVSGFLPFM